MDTALQEITQEIKRQNITSQQQLNLLKREVAKKHKLSTIPTNIELLLSLPHEEIPQYRKILLSKPTRTISGVTPIAIMTAPDRCPHGKCTFCPGGIGSPWGDVPQSYTGHEPATMRGIRNHYDSYLQVINRLQQFVLLGQTIDKVELIIMGGTFPATAPEYQEAFVTGAFQAMNVFSQLFLDGRRPGEEKKEEKSERGKRGGKGGGGMDYFFFKEFFLLPGKMDDQEREVTIQKKLWSFQKKTTLEEEQLKNETSSVRCVALCIETKPDWGFLQHGKEMLRQGCTRVELGIESVYDDVLTITHRGHTTADSKKSIQQLRDLGFKINFHYMPGMPLTDRERDLSGMNQLFSDPDYCPDMIKMYPCMVAPGTALYQQWKKGEFTPISTEEAASRIVEWKKNVPEYCRIQRVQRDVPTKYWEAGVDRTNLRQYLHEKFTVQCRCIRCREPKGKKVQWNNVHIKVMEYEASGGKEYFISAEDRTKDTMKDILKDTIKNRGRDILLGFCRLRFPKESLQPEITVDSALIRELHVYGTATAIGEEGVVQHHGWGKKLLQRAEEIAFSQGKRKIVIISGVGVREYYRRLGYEKEGMYMVKKMKEIIE